MAGVDPRRVGDAVRGATGVDAARRAAQARLRGGAHQLRRSCQRPLATKSYGEKAKAPPPTRRPQAIKKLPPRGEIVPQGDLHALRSGCEGDFELGVPQVSVNWGFRGSVPNPQSTELRRKRAP